MAARKKAAQLKIEREQKKRSDERQAVYAALWETPKYQKLHALRDRIGARWNREDAFQHSPGGRPALAASLSKRLTRVHKKINKVETAALMKKLGVAW